MCRTSSAASWRSRRTISGRRISRPCTPRRRATATLPTASSPCSRTRRCRLKMCRRARGTTWTWRLAITAASWSACRIRALRPICRWTAPWSRPSCTASPGNRPRPVRTCPSAMFRPTLTIRSPSSGPIMPVWSAAAAPIRSAPRRRSAGRIWPPSFTAMPALRVLRMKRSLKIP